MKTPVSTEVLQSQATDHRRLNSLRSKLLDRAFIFQFDGVIDPLDLPQLETAMKQVTYDLVTGRDAAVLVFGTTRAEKVKTHREVVEVVTEGVMRILGNQRSQHSVGCRISTSGPDGTREHHFLPQLTRPQQVTHLLSTLSPDLKTATIVRLLLFRNGVPLSICDLVSLPSAEMAKHKSVARAFNSVSAVLAQTTAKASPLTQALSPTLDIYHPMNPSQVVLICCVTPDPLEFKHSLASLKFTNRLRDCVKEAKSQSKPSWGEIDPSASPSRRTGSPIDERLPEAMQTYKRTLSIDTDFDEPIDEQMPTAKAAPGSRKRNRSMQTAPEAAGTPSDISEIIKAKSRRESIAEYKEKTGNSDVYPEEQGKEEGKQAESPEDEQRIPPIIPKLSIFDQSNVQMCPFREVVTSSTQTIEAPKLDSSTQQTPHLRIAPDPQPVSIRGQQHSFRTLSAQTILIETVDSSSQIVLQVRDEGENTSKVGERSMGLQASIESEERDPGLEALQQENENFFRAHLQDQTTLKELSEELTRAHKENTDLTQQRHNYDRELAELKSELYAARHAPRTPQTSVGVQTEAYTSIERLRRALLDLASAMGGVHAAGLKATQAASKLVVVLRNCDSWEALGEALSSHLETLGPALGESFQALSDELSRTKQDLDISRKRVFDVANLCSTLEGEIRSQQESMSALQGDFAAVREQLRVSEEKVRELLLEKATFANKLTQQESLESRLRSQQGELAAQTVEGSLAAKRLQAAIEEIDSLKADLSSQRLKFRSLESQRSQEHEETTAQFAKLASEAQRSSELAQQLLADNHEKDTVIIALKSQMQTLGDLGALLEEKEVAVAQTRSTLNVVIREKEAAIREAEEIKAKMELLAIENHGNKTVKSHLDAVQKELMQERTRVQELISELDGSKKEKAQIIANKDRAEERFSIELQRKEEAIGSLTAQIANIRQTLKEKVSALQDAEECARVQQQEAERIQLSYDLQHKQISDAFARSKDADITISQLRSEVAKLNSVIATKTDQVTNLQEKAAALSDALKETEMEVARERSFAQQLENRSLGSPTESDLGKTHRPVGESRDIEVAALRKARDRLEVENKQLSDGLHRLSLTLQDLQTSRKLNLESVFGLTLQHLKLRSEPIMEVRDKLREIEAQLEMFLSAKIPGDVHIAQNLVADVQRDLKRHSSPKRGDTARESSPIPSIKPQESSLAMHGYKKKIAPQLKAILSKLQGLLSVEETWQQSMGERLDTLKSSASGGLVNSTDVFRFLQKSLAAAPDYGELSYRGSVSTRAVDHQLCELQSMELKTLISALKTERDDLQSQASILRSALSTKESDFEKCSRNLSQKDMELHKLRKAIRSYEDIIAELRVSLQRAAAETQSAIEEKLQAMGEVQSLQRRLDAMDDARVESPRPILHDASKKNGSLSEYLKQKDNCDSASLSDAMERRPKDSESSNGELKHFQRFKELWRNSPFNAQP